MMVEVRPRVRDARNPISAPQRKSHHSRIYIYSQINDLSILLGSVEMMKERPSGCGAYRIVYPWVVCERVWKRDRQFERSLVVRIPSFIGNGFGMVFLSVTR